MPNQDYKTLLTDVIKKQIAILGPQIVVAKVRSISGIKIDDNGQVLEITDDPQKIVQTLIDQFVQLSGLIIKKTMEPLLTYQLDGAFKPETDINTPAKPNPTPTAPINPPLSTKPLANPMSATTNPASMPLVQSPVINPMPKSKSKPNPIPVSHDLNTPTNPTPTLNPNQNTNNPMPTHSSINPANQTPTTPPIMPAPTPSPMPKPAMPTPPISQPTASNTNNPQIIEHKETAPASIDEETQKIINSALNNK